eukprot:508174_1
MSANEVSAKWINLCACPVADYMTIATGTNKNNYIIIGRKFFSSSIHCIYKYNINTNKWSKICGLNNCNTQKFNAAVDPKKQTLYLFHKDSLTQIQTNLTYNNIVDNKVTYNNTITLKPLYSKSIVINSSIFIFSLNNRAILEWNSSDNKLTKMSDMYNKIQLDDFGIIYDNKNKCLLFGGYDYENDIYVDYILEFNMQTKQWTK